MKPVPLILILMISAGLFAASGPRSAPAVQKANTTTSYVITNDDSPGKAGSTGVTFFPISSGGTLGNSTRVSLGGSGIGGGYFDAARISIFANSSGDSCAFAALAGPAEIGAVDINAQQDIGDFSGSTTDSAGANGIGLANNGTYLYANFTGSNTIATFTMLPGCGLNFLGDISVLGKQKGNVKGMAVHGNLMVV
ncbi:MAG: hypothetical protein WAN03_14710, partial [Candidatus Sulfotelmatobacter sp.]